jgi:hypothetical protein
MFPANEGNQEQRLDALFRAYHDACVAPDPSVNFMPYLWQRIESRQKFSFSFRRVARGFVTAAIAATLAMTLYLVAPHYTAVPSNSTYVDVLAASHNSENSDLYDTVRYDLGSSPDEL